MRTAKEEEAPYCYHCVRLGGVRGVEINADEVVQVFTVQHTRVLGVNGR